MKVLKDFSDLQDNNFIYKAGDKYPRPGYTPSEKRIAELASSENKIGEPVIEAEEPKTTKAEGSEPKKAEQPKKTVKRAKKNEE